MKHWKEADYSWGIRSHNTDGIVLANEEQIFSISKLDEKICIAEECDGHFYTTLTKEEAIEALEEAIEFIKSDDNA